MPDAFLVIYLKSVKKSIQEIYQRSTELGMEQAVFDAAEIIDQKLRSNPRDFGDPISSLPKMQLDLLAEPFPL